MWALNGTMARELLDDGVDAARLAQLRSAGSWLILALFLAVARRDLLRVDRRELPSLALLGVIGLAGVHATYFLAIDRLQIGVAVTIQYLAPLLLLLWLRVAHGRRLAPSLWGAVALSVVGCFFVVRAYDAGSLDAVGVAAAFGAMLTFAIYMVGSERAGERHQPVTTLFWTFGFASLFWALVVPWWGFPFGELESAGNALLAAGPGGGFRLGHPRGGARRGPARGRGGRARRGRLGPGASPRSRGGNRAQLTAYGALSGLEGVLR
jgi:drug/metabolite transporter (DMT)-like permease